jgi:S1-C subfamily serine protease
MIPIIAAAAIAQSVVLVVTQKTAGTKTGTGFVIASTSTKSDVLTADHVVTDGIGSYVYLGGPRGDRYPATIVQSDPLRDAAVLEIPIGGLPVLGLAAATTPSSGTKVQVLGYPTTHTGAASPQPSVANPPEAESLPLSMLVMTTLGGSIDGETEQGESILFNVAVTHGDSGAPVVDDSTGEVVAMVLGLANGYGSSEWMSGDGLGLSVAGLQSVIFPLLPNPPPPKPAYSVVIEPNADPTVSASFAQLGLSAAFTPLESAKAATCIDGSRSAVANAMISESGDPNDLSIDVTDCSGALIYHDALYSDLPNVPNLIRLIDRSFLGFVDSHRSQWISLLRFGVAADPVANPYLALMSLERNPFGQMIVGHTFRGGPADLAGIVPGDAVIKIDGRPTRALGDQFIARLMNQPTVTLMLDRQLREFSVRLRLQRFSQLTKDGPVPR